MAFELVFVTLFSVATAVALVARWLRVPYTVALVAAGLVLGETGLLEPPHLTKALLYAVFLPGLLFEAAFHLEFGRFWRNKIVIFSLAVPGVVVVMALTAAILVPAANALHFVDGFRLGHGLVFGALIAATDPIAVVALFKSLGVPKQLAVLVEGESLLNDGTAVVLFSIVFALVVGGDATFGTAAVSFLEVVGLGLLVGAAFGLGMSKITQQLDDPMIEITLTTIAAYGSFVVAEEIHASGVLATVTAGMLCGNYAAKTGMSPSTRIAVESFWDYVAFALNSIVFLLIGFEVSVSSLLDSWKAILAAFAAVALARVVVVALAGALIRKTRERLPKAWGTVLAWAGLRGGLSMVLVLGLPRDFVHRDLLVTMTFGVVILSIVVQGLSMGPLLRRLGLVSGGADLEGLERSRGSLRAARAALRALDRMQTEDLVQLDVAQSLRDEYEARAREAEEGLRALHAERQDLHEGELRSTRRLLLLAEKDDVLESVKKGVLSQETSRSLLQAIDDRIVRLDRADEGSPEE